MTYANTTLLGLNQPTTGSESGVWGDDINNGTTQLIEVSIVGSNTISYDGNVTLSVSNGSNASSFGSTTTTSTSSGVAQYPTLILTGARTALRTITAPSSSRIYRVINQTTGGYNTIVNGSATTGVSIPSGASATLIWNGSDFQGVSTVVGNLTFTDTNILASFQTSVNTYSQIVNQNSNSGTTASADFIVGNNNTTATTYYGDFGMNSSGFTGSGAFNAANTVYLTSTTGDLALGTTTANGIHFVVNSGTTDAMAISSSGTVTINGSSITLGGNFTTSGAYTTTLTTTGNTSVTLPTSGTLLTTTGSGSSLTFGTGSLSLAGNLTTSGAYTQTITATGNTSVTLPTSGTLISSSTALSGAVTGTPSSTTYLRGDGTWATISAGGVTTFSAGSTGLTPSTATSGAVTLAGTLGIANGGTGLSTTPTNGQLLIGNGTNYTAAALTAGSNVTITNGSGSITIAASSPLTYGSIGTYVIAATNYNNSSVGTVTAGSTTVAGSNLYAANPTYTNYYAMNAPQGSTDTNSVQFYSANFPYISVGSGTWRAMTGASSLGASSTFSFNLWLRIS